MSRSDSLRLFIFGMFAASLAAMMFYIPFEYMPFKLRISLTDQVGKPVAVTNLLLAGQLCERQLRDNLGGRLVSSYIDHRSSRYDESRQLFLVLLYASTGDAYHPEQIRVHCRVKPNATRIDYFGVFKDQR
jgi:hypothetical protein